MHYLSNIWTLWLHLPHDNDWSVNSYKKIYTFNTLEDAILIIENINKVIVESSMLFLMKNNIKPIWEDEENNKGGSICYKISSDEVYNVWKKINYYLIGETITNNTKLLHLINGISISPKKNFCIIKIWLGNMNVTQLVKEISLFNTLDLSNNNLEDPFKIDILCNIKKQTCVFKIHNSLY